jgi:Signal peptidase, peptidase S26
MKSVSQAGPGQIGPRWVGSGRIGPGWIGPVSRIYSALLYAYPSEFRAQFGGEMQQVVRDRCRAVSQTNDVAQVLRFLALTVKDWLITSFQERIGNPIRWGTLARHPATIWMLAIFMCLFASTRLVHAYVISAGSMEGTLRIGDHVLADKLHSKAGDIQRVDMITFLSGRS